MTDNEIIKAFECLCWHHSKCRECPYSPRYEFPLCQRQIAKYALDLINRQKAEIVNLKDYNEELLAEIRKLKGSTIVDNVTENQERIRREAEAYKAFAEHSKEKWWFNTTRMVGEEE